MHLAAGELPTTHLTACFTCFALLRFIISRCKWSHVYLSMSAAWSVYLYLYMHVYVCTNTCEFRCCQPASQQGIVLSQLLCFQISCLYHHYLHPTQFLCCILHAYLSYFFCSSSSFRFAFVCGVHSRHLYISYLEIFYITDKHCFAVSCQGACLVS